ncbi:AAA family ATPase [Desulforamulus hydrothermalis]|uniref:ATPase central domain-containing protein n=1 Tax=Desulforamulus hydrothermalis Lam5 = DSM 18033 TaxID=1121428 RepID=K8E9F2_9FIRM|nr:AAA family ATPase [Desulforamulus hydrothermalis]CCO08188.1 ATPase central domain-containing protein [Desulforamulus hydrothermalis Lam5 = DSM 18033]SHH22893.1 stage V sporulation protein K [Desulforamulus hydrothermalis Lam5 = DSM 18033]
MVNPIIEATLRDLEELPGLVKFKHAVEEIGSMALAGELAGQPVNFVFIGSPGTGKVALARLLGEMLYRLQILRKDQLFGVHKSDLRGRSWQEVLQRVKGLVEKAQGGIIYVDQVTEIANLGKEVLQVMLDARETMIVLSGTQEELSALLGDADISAKISYRLEFPDYTPEELLDVALRFAEDYQLTLTPEAATKLYNIFISRQPELAQLGNTRYAKDIIDKAYRRAASRIMTGGVTDKLFPEDIEG